MIDSDLRFFGRTWPIGAASGPGIGHCPPQLHLPGQRLPAMEAAPLGAAGAAGLRKPFCPKAARELVGSVDAFVFDCDGVIWKGEKLIAGVTNALQALRSMGKKVGFVTNNSTKSRKQYVEKFQGLGISVREEEIYPSSFGAAMYLKVNNFSQDKKVYAIGGDGILEEMALAGYTCLGVTKDANKKMELKPGFKFEHDKSVGAVVVGLDPYINYYKIQYATMCIRENPRCLFIATDCDAVGPLTDVQEWPGTGSMVGAICGSTQKEPIIVGKPATFMMEFLLKRFNMSTSRMCMVGDSFPDVLFGQNSGCKTMLVLSGVTTLPVLQDPENNIHPDYYTNKMSDIVDLLGL